jgi:phosphohistidine phosphatase SixA
MSGCRYVGLKRVTAAAGLVGLLAISDCLLDRPAHAAGGLPDLIVLVRHAEKATTDLDLDPDLTAAGGKRARDLAIALKDAHLTAIVTTQYRRTQQTAKPIADALGVTPQIVKVPDFPDESEQLRAYVTEALELLRKQSGGAVLVVGHSNTVPALVEALMEGPPLPFICDSIYDKLFILFTRDGGTSSLLQSRYGSASGTQGCE